MLLPCLAAARLLQEEAEQDCGEGQAAARCRMHSGAQEWEGDTSSSQHHGPALRCHLHCQLQAEEGEGCTAVGCVLVRTLSPPAPGCRGCCRDV